jgi:DNA-binding MarR family transcriptional regulator
MYTRNEPLAQIARCGDVGNPSFIACADPLLNASEQAAICSPASHRGRLAAGPNSAKVSLAPQSSYHRFDASATAAYNFNVFWTLTGSVFVRRVMRSNQDRALTSRKDKRKPPFGRKPVPSQHGEISYGHLPGLVGYRIRKAYSYLFQTFTFMLQDPGLAPGQYSVLLLIALNPGLSQLALAEATGLDGSTIVPITNRFAQRGWIRRIRRRNDRRFYVLSIAPAGRAILDRVRPIIEAHERNLVVGLSKAECHALIELLAKITDNRLARDFDPKVIDREDASGELRRPISKGRRQSHPRKASSRPKGMPVESPGAHDNRETRPRR